MTDKPSRFRFSPEDAELVAAHTWCIHLGYPTTNIDRKTVRLHQLIMRPQKGMRVDHINRDKLDNRRENLRLVNGSRNAINTPKRRDNTSGYRGVSWHSSNELWRARIWNNGIPHLLGYFRDRHAAALAYNKAAAEMHGEFAQLNSIHESPELLK